MAHRLESPNDRAGATGAQAHAFSQCLSAQQQNRHLRHHPIMQARRRPWHGCTAAASAPLTCPLLHRCAAPAVQSKDGTYQRPSYSFKDQLGSPGFPLEKGRYHLYVGNACPWCHRVLLALVVCGLEEYVRWVPAAPCCDGSVDLPGRCDCNHHIPSARPQHQAGRCPRDAHAAHMQLTSHPPAAHLQLLPGGRQPRAGQPGRLGVRLARPGVWLPGPEASCITCRGCKP